MKGLLYSGGVESAYLLQSLDGEIQPVYVSYGFPWEEYERKKAMQHVERVERAEELMEIEVRHDDPSRLRRDDVSPEDKYFTYIHGRSSSLITNASVELTAMDVTDIYEGTLASGDRSFRDSSRGFYDAIEDALSTGLDDDLSIHTPLYGREKAEIVAELINREFEVGFDDTVSCILTDDPEGCGDCYKCHEREKARKEAESLID
ncbi:MAG: 7-cyano-7-deazaguanine synthase [Halobacteria archaeon]|nr:7-cyano-7-deazaguanine synthase [Halobacteria archaeon]